MPKSKNEKENRFLTPIEKQIKKQIGKGIEIANDPLNASKSDLAIRVTTYTSPWYTKECSVCSFKFREEDRVRICPNCEKAYHADNRSVLNCLGISPYK